MRPEASTSFSVRMPSVPVTFGRGSYRQAVAEVHAAIYNPKGKDRECIEDVLERCYEQVLAYGSKRAVLTA